MLDFNKLIEEYCTATNEIKAVLVEAKKCDDAAQMDLYMENISELLNYRDEILNYLKNNCKDGGLFAKIDELRKTEKEIEELLTDRKSAIEGELTSLTQKINATSKYKSTNQ